MPFWTEHNFQPKRANRFRVELRPIDSILSCDIKGNKRKINELNIEWHYIVSIDKPTYTMAAKKYNYINTEVRFAQPIKWNPITITLLDIVDSEILETIKRSQYEYLYTKNDYRFQSTPNDSWAKGNEIDIYQLDENGKDIEKWSIENALFTNIKYSNLDYNSENLSTIQITLEYDDAQLISTREGISQENYLPEETFLCWSEEEECIESKPPEPEPQVQPVPQEVKTPTKSTETVIEKPATEEVTADLSADLIFKKASSELTEKGKEELVKLIEEAGYGAVVDITGFASIEGTEEYNQKLSQNRADAVAEFLKEEGEFVVNTSQGKGETTEFSDKSLSPNRRVQVTYETPSENQFVGPPEPERQEQNFNFTEEDLEEIVTNTEQNNITGEMNFDLQNSPSSEETSSLPEGSYVPGDESIPTETQEESTFIPEDSGSSIEKIESQDELIPIQETDSQTQQTLIREPEAQDSSFYLPEGVSAYDSTEEIPPGYSYSDVELQEGQTLVAGESSAVLEFVDANQSQYNISYNSENDPENNIVSPSYVIASED